MPSLLATIQLPLGRLLAANLNPLRLCSAPIRFHGTGKPKTTEDPVKPRILRKKTPIGRLDELEEGKHPYQEKEPLPPFPDNTNPITGEIGGPRGPEPTRYGDWERKGRVSDF